MCIVQRDGVACNVKALFNNITRRKATVTLAQQCCTELFLTIDERQKSHAVETCINALPHG